MFSGNVQRMLTSESAKLNKSTLLRVTVDTIQHEANDSDSKCLSSALPVMRLIGLTEDNVPTLLYRVNLYSCCALVPLLDPGARPIIATFKQAD